MSEYRWVGSERNFVDEIHTKELDNNVVIGHFGGNSSSGQYKNEDGCLLWVNPEEDWEFVILLDAHNTAQSAELVLATFENEKESIYQLLKMKTNLAFNNISSFILSTFKSKDFRKASSTIRGETACLFVIRKENFLYWFSVGDCILHLNHPELVTLGEYQQNHRSFYEWVGQESTFNKTVPCYSSGTKELRKGDNHILLTTDGLVECPNTNFKHPPEIFKVFDGVTNQVGVSNLLKAISEKDVRDSTTIISWQVFNNKCATFPSDKEL